MFEKIKEIWSKNIHGNSVKKKKVTYRDIQKNVIKIQNTMEYIQNDIKTIVSKMEKVDRKTESGIKEYNSLVEEFKLKNDIYSTLQKEQEQEYATIKKMRDAKSISTKDAFLIGGVIFLGSFAFALERENPKALKIATFLLKFAPLHI